MLERSRRGGGVKKHLVVGPGRVVLALLGVVHRRLRRYLVQAVVRLALPDPQELEKVVGQRVVRVERFPRRERRDFLDELERAVVLLFVGDARGRAEVRGGDGDRRVDGGRSVGGVLMVGRHG